MDIKVGVDSDRRKIYHMQGRLRKAACHAKELLELCEQSGRCDERTIAEVWVRVASPTMSSP